MSPLRFLGYQCPKCEKVYEEAKRCCGKETVPVYGFNE